MNLLVRKLFYYLISSIWGIFGYKNSGISVYCYHSFGSDSWEHGVSKEMFERQIKFLIKQSKPCDVDSLKKAIVDRKTNSGFVITIDDGYKDVIKTVPIFDKYGIKPILFVLAGEVVNRKELNNNKPFLTVGEVKNLINKGWIIGNHSMTHSDFYSLDDREIKKEIIESKKNLESRLGVKIKYFAYPKGRYNARILNIVKQVGYEMAFSMDDGFIGKNTDTMIIPRIGVSRSHDLNEFKILNNPGVIYFRMFVKFFLKRLGVL